MVAVIKEKIPAELKAKISPAMLMFHGTPGVLLKSMCIGVVAVVLYGISDHNGFLYLLGACIGPGAVVILYKLVPLRPYRGVFYNKSMHDIDTSDPVVMRLVELYRSEEAYRHLCGQALKLSGVLFVIVWSATLLLGHRVNWSLSFPSSRFWGFMLFCFVGCFGVMGAGYNEWGVMTWARRETAMSTRKD